MFRSSKKDRTKSASSSVASHDQAVVAASSSVAESVSDNNTNNGNGTLVQLTMADLQGLLQSHTNQLEYIFQSEMASLQSQLESIVEQKLESKLAQAEHNVKQFMKESIDDDDDDDDKKSSSTNNKELQDIKNQVASLEQSVSRIAGMANNQGVEVEYQPPTTTVNTNSSTMETSRVMECCTRLEQVVEERLQKMESLLVTTMNTAKVEAIPKPRPLQRSKSTDGVSFSPQGTMNGILATLRLHMDELITQRLNTMEQFIDSRHAELEAYVSSHGEKLHKDMIETLSNNSSSGGGITKEELEAILDARIQEEDDEEADAMAQMSASHRRKSQQQQQPAAESSTQQNGPYSNTVVVQALERLIQVQQEWIAVQSSTQDLELKVQQKLDLLQQVDSNHGSIYPPSSTELYQKMVSKMESLEQLVLATLTTNTTNTTKMPSSSRRKQRASSTTSGSGNNKKPMDNSSRVSNNNSNNNTNDNSSKRKSKRKPTATTTATTATATNKGLAQIIDSNHTDNKNRGRLPDDTSTLVARTGQTIVDITSVIATDAYLDVSVDGRRPDLDDDDDDDNRAAAAATADDIISDSDNEADIDIDTSTAKQPDDANLVNKFMNTLSNWKELTEKQEDVKFIGAQNIDEKGVVDDDDDNDSDDDDDDEEDDDIDSNASMSVDSSVAGGGDDHAAMNRNTTKALLRLESKLDGLEDKVHRLLVASGHHHHHGMTTDTTPNASMSALYNTAPVPSERSTNAKHSRDRPLSSVEEVQQMISVTHNALKHDLQQWLLDQQDESRYSQVRDGGMETSEDTQSAQPLSSSRQVSQSNQTNKNLSSSAMTPEQLPGVTDKLLAIETIVTTLESFMQEQRRLAVPPVPQELPMLKNVLGQSHYELERKILRHLDTLDKSVQFKLDEIYAHLQQQGRRRLEEVDLALLSPEDQSAIAEAIKTRLHEMQHAITTQLKESIPDYGNAKSVIGEALEEMRQIVSEVAISEVELLKTQLGVAEEAEQEALHAVVVLREMLEESKEQERRAHYAELTGLPTSTAVQPASSLFSFAPFAKLGLGGASVPAPQQRSNNNFPDRFRTRQLSIGHQSHASGLTPIPHQGSASASIWSTTNNPYPGTGMVNKHRSPQQKLEDWKSQVANLEDKSADLRSLYNQLRGQEAEDWAESSNQRAKLAPEGSGDVKAGLKISSRFATGETKLGEGGNEGELSST